MTGSRPTSLRGGRSHTVSIPTSSIGATTSRAVPEGGLMANAWLLSLRNRFALWTESFFMTRLVARDRVGPFLRFLFRLPLFFKRIGLGVLIPRNVLILTTTGRRSGRPHTTPVEFGPGPDGQAYMVMSGWGGHTDWCRNLRADPCVRVWLRRHEWEARGEPVPDADVARV